MEHKHEDMTKKNEDVAASSIEILRNEILNAVKRNKELFEKNIIELDHLNKDSAKVDSSTQDFYSGKSNEEIAEAINISKTILKLRNYGLKNNIAQLQACLELLGESYVFAKYFYDWIKIISQDPFRNFERVLNELRKLDSLISSIKNNGIKFSNNIDILFEMIGVKERSKANQIYSLLSIEHSTLNRLIINLLTNRFSCLVTHSFIYIKLKSFRPNSEKQASLLKDLQKFVEEKNEWVSKFEDTYTPYDEVSEKMSSSENDDNKIDYEKEDFLFLLYQSMNSLSNLINEKVFLGSTTNNEEKHSKLLKGFNSSVTDLEENQYFKLLKLNQNLIKWSFNSVLKQLKQCDELMSIIPVRYCNDIYSWIMRNSFYPCHIKNLTIEISELSKKIFQLQNNDPKSFNELLRSAGIVVEIEDDVYFGDRAKKIILNVFSIRLQSLVTFGKSQLICPIELNDRTGYRELLDNIVNEHNAWINFNVLPVAFGIGNQDSFFTRNRPVARQQVFGNRTEADKDRIFDPKQDPDNNAFNP